MEIDINKLINLVQRGIGEDEIRDDFCSLQLRLELEAEVKRILRNQEKALTPCPNNLELPK